MNIEKLVKSLSQIEKILLKNSNISTLVNEVMTVVAEAINCDSAAVSYIKGDHWEVQYVYNFDESVIGMKIPLEDEPHANLALSLKELQFIEDTGNDLRVNKERLSEWKIRSVVVAPLFTRNKDLGVIFYNFNHLVRFPEDTMVQMNHFSSSLSLALENASLIESLQVELATRSANEKKLVHLNKILMILSKCSNLMIEARGVTEYLEQICSTIISESNLALTWVGFIKGNIIVPEIFKGSASGYVKDLIIRIDHGPTSLGPTGSAVRNQKVFVCNNIRDSSFEPWFQKAQDYKINSSLSIPLIIHGEPIGVINLYSYDSDFFNDDEILLFSELGKYISHGVMSIRYEVMKKEAQLSLHESEEQFRMLAHKSNAIIIEADLNGKIIYSNEKYFKLIEGDEKLIEGLIKLISEQIKVQQNEEFDCSIIDFKGKQRWFSFHKSIIINPLGIMRFSFLIFEITTRKENETRLLKQTEQLENLNATKDKFFSIIAHDLKNPFTSIIGASELLTENSNNFTLAQAQHLGSIIFDSAKRGFALLQNLLDWSRSQTGMISFYPEEIKINDLVSHCMADAETAALKKNIKLVLNHSPEIRIYADKNMLCTIMRNLVLNAIKYSWENSSVMITVSEELNRILVSVKDEGVGITGDNIKKLFRIDSGFTMPGTMKEQGTGLGLLLCHEFVSKHNGEIWVTSTPGKGSTFSFTLPKNF